LPDSNIHMAQTMRSGNRPRPAPSDRVRRPTSSSSRCRHSQARATASPGGPAAGASAGHTDFHAITRKVGPAGRQRPVQPMTSASNTSSVQNDFSPLLADEYRTPTFCFPSTLSVDRTGKTIRGSPVPSTLWLAFLFSTLDANPSFGHWLNKRFRCIL